MIPESRRQLSVLTVFLAIAAAATALAVVLGPAPVARPPASGTEAPLDGAGSRTPVAVVESVTPSVAFITTFNGTGSGVLVAEGLVVTNAHVIWPFEVVGVRFPEGERRWARVIGVDPRSDLALLEVPGPGLPPPLEMGRSGSLLPGEPLYVVGYPAVADLAPEPSVAAAPFLGGFDWEFSGVGWLAADAAAIGGQSGGALVDAAGRLVGVTTFGSATEVYAVAAPDVVTVAEALTLSTDAIEGRRPPRSGGDAEQRVVIEGPWSQATFVIWVPPGTPSRLEGPPNVTWRALDPFGLELAAGNGDIDVTWLLGTPGILHAASGEAVDATVSSGVPIIPAPDPDDGRIVSRDQTVAGFVDVPGDRDWYYVEHTEAGPVTVEVEAQTRMRVALYNRSSSALVAQVVNQRGFFFDDPPLVVPDLAAGSYVIVVEDVAAQFGTYELRVG